MFLITGCGRSGTKYITEVLRQCGLDVGHETLGKDGVVSSIWAVYDSYYPSYHHQGPRPHFDTVLHQVRHPLDTIGSLMTSSAESWYWNARHIPIDPERWSPLRKAEAYYWHWNHLVSHEAVYRYRVEDLVDCWPVVCAFVGLPTDTALPDVPKDTNHRDHPTVQWKNLFPGWQNLIQRMAKEYGYEVA